MSDDDEIVFEFSEMYDELRAYRVLHFTDGTEGRELIATGEEAHRMKYGRGYLE